MTRERTAEIGGTALEQGRNLRTNSGAFPQDDMVGIGAVFAVVAVFGLAIGASIAALAWAVIEWVM